jgi:hypothetical protein
MADSEQEKAEKLAAAKKRVSIRRIFEQDRVVEVRRNH